jgi:hypothetical protein
MPDELELGKNFAQKVAADLVHSEKRGRGGHPAKPPAGTCTVLPRTRQMPASPARLLTYEDYRELASDSSAEKQLLDFQVEQLRAEGNYGRRPNDIRGSCPGSWWRKLTSGSVVGKQDNHAALTCWGRC